MLEYLYTNHTKYLSGKDGDYSEALKHTSTKNGNGDLLCLFLQNPNEAEIQRLCADFSLEEKYFRKYKTEHRSLRYSFDPLIFTFTDYYTDNANRIKTSHLLFVIKKNLLILAVSAESAYYKDLFSRVLENAKKKKIKSPAFILYEFLHQDTKENYDVLERVDDQIARLEQKIINNKDADRKILQDILSVKKYLIKMNKRLWASSKIIFTIKKDLTSIKLTHEEQALLDDIYDTLLHQIDLIETQKEQVTDFLEIFTTTISNRLAETSNELNMVMKKMAALTIIIMVPTFIAGIYGMNFTHMPELNWLYGYGFALGVMIFGAIGTYYFFHKKRWI